MEANNLLWNLFKPQTRWWQFRKTVYIIWILFLIDIPHVNFPYKTSIDEQLILYNITRCYSKGQYCHVFAIAAGDIIK